MTVIEINPEENNDPPVEEIVEELTDTIETVTEELTDTIEELADNLEESQHTCDPHCEEIHRKIAELEEKIAVTQEHIVDEKVEEIVNSEPKPEPEPEPEPTPEPEPIPEETPIIEPEATLIEPPPGRTEKSGPNGFFKALKAIGF